MASADDIFIARTDVPAWLAGSELQEPVWHMTRRAYEHSFRVHGVRILPTREQADLCDGFCCQIGRTYRTPSRSRDLIFDVAMRIYRPWSGGRSTGDFRVSLGISAQTPGAEIRAELLRRGFDSVRFDDGVVIALRSELVRIIRPAGRVDRWGYPLPAGS